MDWMTAQSYARLYHLHPQTLANWRHQDRKAGRSEARPGYPHYRRFGGAVRYLADNRSPDRPGDATVQMPVGDSPITISSQESIASAPGNHEPVRIASAIETIRHAGPALPSVYIIEAIGADAVKIGVAVKPHSRIGSLQMASCFPLRLLFVHTGGKRLESRLHEIFKPEHLHGEWFKVGRTMREFLGKVAEIPKSSL